MSTQPRRLGLALACALALLNSACVVSPLVVDDRGGPFGTRPGQTQNQGNNPVLQALTANPTATADKDAKITFTVVATSPTGAPLQYNWSATKGTLSSNTGQLITWSPTKSDGSLDTPGDAQISVIITNASGGSVVGTANVKILADGSTKVGPIATTPASPSPNATPTPVASAAPSASPSPSPSASASADTDASGTDTSGDTDASGSDTDASGSDISGSELADCSVEAPEDDEVAPGDTVVFTGKNFSEFVTVKIDGVEAEVLSFDNTTLKVEVPETLEADDEAVDVEVELCTGTETLEGALTIVEADNTETADI